MLATGYYMWGYEYFIIVRNSWGIGFGTRGYVHIPLSLMLDPSLTFDFWTLRTSESDEAPKPIVPTPPTKPIEPPAPVEPMEPLPPLWKNKMAWAIVGIGVLSLLYVLIK